MSLDALTADWRALRATVFSTETPPPGALMAADYARMNNISTDAGEYELSQLMAKGKVQSGIFRRPTPFGSRKARYYWFTQKA